MTVIAQSFDDDADAAGRAQDVRTLITAVALLGGTLAITVTIQAVFVQGLTASDLRGEAWAPLREFARRVPVNLLTVAIAIIVAVRLHVQRLRPRIAAATIFGICLAASGLRLVGQFAIGVYDRSTALAGALDALTTATVLSLVFWFALWITRGQQNARAAERRAILPAVRSSDAAASMHHADLRRRRAAAFEASTATAERLDRIEAALSHLSREVSGSAAITLDEARNELDALRQRDLRRLAAQIYPVATDEGLVPALRALIGRIPPTIDAALTVPPDDEIDVGEPAVIALIVGVAEDGIGTALQHGRASRLRLSVRRSHRAIVLNLVDDGAPALDLRLSATDSVRRRIEQLGGHFHIEGEPAGQLLKARVPLRSAG